MTAADERKKRQEKFRKRTGSLFDKVEKLARDTDAFVSLVVCDRTGKARSFRASDRPYWPHSIKELIVSTKRLDIHDTTLNNTKRSNTPQGLTSISRSVPSSAAGKL
jgi:hypothetical protein